MQYKILYLCYIYIKTFNNGSEFGAGDFLK
jgi:hypothetical protein